MIMDITALHFVNVYNGYKKHLAAHRNCEMEGPDENFSLFLWAHVKGK